MVYSLFPIVCGLAIPFIFLGFDAPSLIIGCVNGAAFCPFSIVLLSLAKRNGSQSACTSPRSAWWIMLFVTAAVNAVIHYSGVYGSSSTSALAHLFAPIFALIMGITLCVGSRIVGVDFS